MSVSEVQKLAKEANDFGIGNKLGKYVLESSDKLTGEAGKVSHQYKSGLRTQPEISSQFISWIWKKWYKSIYSFGFSWRYCKKVFASNKSYGYNLSSDSVYGMRLEMNGDNMLPNINTVIHKHRLKESEVINKYLKPKHGGKDPLLVAGDSEGDVNMLSEYKGTKALLLMKRKGKLDNLAKRC